MSKKVKKSLEERLEEALVPEGEQLYNIPENWLWAKGGLTFETIRGVSYKKSQVSNEKSNYSSLIIRGGNIQKGEIVNQDDNIYAPDDIIKDKQFVRRGDVVIVSSTGSNKIIGKSATVKEEVRSLSFGAFLTLLRPKEVFNKVYFGSYFLSSLYRGRISALAKGSNINNIKREHFEKLNIPIPPPREQKRIADKVEHLFSKIDEAQQLIEEVKESFELRRAAILDKAFRGELTAKWRDQKDNSSDLPLNIKADVGSKKGSKYDGKVSQPYTLPDDWSWVRMRDVAKFKNGYAFKSKDFVDEGHQLIRMGNLYNNKLDLHRNPVYLPESYDEQMIDKYSVTSDEILVSLTGTKYKRDYGYAIKVGDYNRRLLLNQRILSMEPYFLKDYFYYYLQSSTFRDMFFSFETGGVNQGNVSSTSIQSIYFPLPPEDEGLEIQRKIDLLLEAEKDALNVISMEEEVELLKQSILNKAFRGELGTNDPLEENAIELLKEVLQTPEK